MPKFKKELEKKEKSKKKKVTDDEFMYRSIIITAIIGMIFLVISLFFNGTQQFYEGVLVGRYVSNEVHWEILDNCIKASVIIVCFFFMLISLANYKELIGKPATGKELFLLFGLALAQTMRNFWVFLITIIGLVAVLIYLYLVQDN